jgi:hypothetical protein
MSNENFNSIKELEDAESNQVFSKVDKPIPNVSDFSEYVTPEEVTDGLSYKAPKPTVERRELTIEERLAQSPRYKDKSKLETILFGPDIELQGDWGIPAQRVVERLYRKGVGKEVEPVDNFSTTEAMVAAIIDGNIKSVTFPLNIATEVIDLARGAGVDPDKSTVAKLEKYFEDSVFGKVATEAEDIAFSDAAGKLTSAAVQILGLSKPTQALSDWGFKTANRYFEAAKIGKVATNSKSLERATKEAVRLNQLSGKQKFASFMIGGGIGMAAVADPEEFGTLSELLEGTRFENTLGVLGLDREKKQDPQDEAARRLWNRAKLGIEQGLITWPILFVGGKVGNIINKQSKDVYASNDDLDRWIEKYFMTPFKAKGVKVDELFEEMQRVKGKISSGQVASIDIIKDIDATLLKIAKESNISKGTPELKRLIGRMDELLVTGSDIIKGKEFLFKGFDPKKLSEFRKFASTELGLGSGSNREISNRISKS